MTVSVARLTSTSAVYREEQNFAWWVYSLLASVVILGGAAVIWGRGANAGWGTGLPIALGLSCVVPTLLIVLLLRMTTEVHPTECIVWFGWLPTYREVVPLASIKVVEAVTYRPLRDCGGWGIRRGVGDERVLNARGDRGVRLTLIDGDKILIGSQRAEELAQALDHARRVAS